MRRSLFSLLIIAVIGIIVYSNTLKAPFVWDDNHLIVENSRIRDLSNFTDISGTRYLTFLSFAINYAINGYDVTGYHIFNIAIHILNAMLIYWLVALLLGMRDTGNKMHAEKGIVHRASWIALFAGIIFVSHPVHTMAVTNINQRSVLLATCFYLLSVVMYMKWRLTQSSRTAEQQENTTGLRRYFSVALLFYCASLLSAVLAMKCKEISFTLPFVILLFDRCFFGRECGFKKSVVYAIPILLTLLIIPLDKPQPDVFYRPESHTFMIENRNVLSGLDAKNLSFIPRKDYMFTELRVILTYARLFFLPANLNFDYDYPIYQSFLNPDVFLSFLFLLSISGFGIYLFYRSRKADSSLLIAHSDKSTTSYKQIISFGILWFFIVLSIESGVAVLNYVIFEYRLYLPSIGIILLLTGLTAYAAEHRVYRFGYISSAVVAIAIVFSVAAYKRNEIIGTPISLWEDVIRKSPRRIVAYNNLGIAFMDKGRTSEAMQVYKDALRLRPDYPIIHFNLGNAYKKQGLLNEAIDEYKKALKSAPDLAEAHYILGTVYAQQGRFDEAIGEYNAVLRLKPDFAEAHNNLANIYLKLGNIDNAITHYQAALRLNPNLAAAHYNLGLAYKQKGLISEAMKEFQTALAINPNFLQAYRDMQSLGK